MGGCTSVPDGARTPPLQVQPSGTLNSAEPGRDRAPTKPQAESSSGGGAQAMAAGARSVEASQEPGSKDSVSVNESKDATSPDAPLRVQPGLTIQVNSAPIRDDRVFQKGEIVMYKNRERVTIVGAHHEDPTESYYTIRKADGSERQTVLKYILSIEEYEKTRPAPLPPTPAVSAARIRPATTPKQLLSNAVTLEIALGGMNGTPVTKKNLQKMTGSGLLATIEGLDEPSPGADALAIEPDDALARLKRDMMK